MITILKKISILGMTVLLGIFVFTGNGYSGEIPSEGKDVPNVRLQRPDSETDIAYLGIGNTPDFSLADIQGKVLIAEIVGVYCPKCHIQNPRFNQMFQRIEKNKKMKDQVKMIAVAAGATPAEKEFWIKQYQVPFPVFADPKFEIHKALGEPRTPFTMLITGGKKVAFTHLGAIEDMDSFFLKIQSLLP